MRLLRHPFVGCALAVSSCVETCCGFQSLGLRSVASSRRENTVNRLSALPEDLSSFSPSSLGDGTDVVSGASDAALSFLLGDAETPAVVTSGLTEDQKVAEFVQSLKTIFSGLFVWNPVAFVFVSFGFFLLFRFWIYLQMEQLWVKVLQRGLKPGASVLQLDGRNFRNLYYYRKDLKRITMEQVTPGGPDDVAMQNEALKFGLKNVYGDPRDVRQIGEMGPPREFDYVLSYRALSRRPDADKVIQFAARMLKPGGRLIIMEPDSGQGGWISKLRDVYALASDWITPLKAFPDPSKNFTAILEDKNIRKYFRYSFARKQNLIDPWIFITADRTLEPLSGILITRQDRMANSELERVKFKGERVVYTEKKKRKEQRRDRAMDEDEDDEDEDEFSIAWDGLPLDKCGLVQSAREVAGSSASDRPKIDPLTAKSSWVRPSDESAEKSGGKENWRQGKNRKKKKKSAVARIQNPDSLPKP
uniref:Methyltransferase type 11 domain-containing protein n=1 Tax=Chromera velia CCMP2878 TaxID=1169474 RepID=A0A0G4ICD8_9ALVE|mmetsp:Transcript_21842/g.43382  ORF Transcript_21842/g.43382 Transcript_21842/m.43382 type:complete len:475 (+) Transcript_21842:100-1524(+)|eukprot:Cvel_13117.t1-p1 / transcript=Cvel_13117.t1 / gene=Cvel_13117 / organism=Chromera_velia_CCMP2878 / gene_product=hypothetical protein / transcript_product=hypothetical protein / location=Cvel_scaffold884:18653-22750(-) / protein_length=474 / sequence_SO=supercontig / SO=protein_coding / is_pseudo=false